MGLFKLLFLFSLGYFVFRLIGFLLRFRRAVNNQQSGQDSNRKEGEVSINLNSEKKKHIPKNDGDYIDYEDV